MWFVKRRLSVVDRCCIYTNQLDLAILYQPTGGIRVYPYTQTYKKDFRYKWYTINLDKAFVQKCNGYKGPTDFFVSCFCFLLSRLAFDCARSPDSAQRWRSWIGMVSSLKSKEKMEQRNLFGFCTYVTLMTMICIRLSMSNGIFGFTARKIQREPKKKEGKGEGEGKMMMMMMMI